MKSAEQETELKFFCGPDDLAAVLAAAPAGDDETRELISVYFDTPELTLQKAGASLRVREHKGRRTQTLKRGRGLVREEHEAPIEGLAPDPALEPLPSLLPRGATLRPAFNVRVSRRQRTFRYKDAEIELALDQGEVTGGDRQSLICEVELELKSGPPAALFALARELSAAAPLYLAFDSKAARGQALVGGGRPAHQSDKVELTEEGTVGEAFQAIARKALAQIAANAAGLRRQPEPETVHQLRVAARRLRSALSTFSAVLDGADLAAAKSDLAWLSHACDTARNLDVFADEMLKPAEQSGEPSRGLHALRKTVDAARRAAWAEAAEAASSERFRSLMIDVTAWVEIGEWRHTPEALAPLASFAERALKRHLKKVVKRGAEARDGDDAMRHRLRIETKKLRYAADAFGDLYGERRAGRYLQHLKDLQENLGFLNDLATAHPLVEGLKLSPEAALAAGALIGLKAAGKPRLIERSMKALHRLEASKSFWN